MNKFTLSIPEEISKKIKILAADCGLTKHAFIMRCITKSIDIEDILITEKIVDTK